MSQPVPKPSARGSGESSPAARNLTEWFRQLDRYVRMVRTFGPGASTCVSARDRLLEDFVELLGYHAPFVLHCTPLEILLRDEAVVRPPASGSAEAQGNLERRIPFVFYRDGIRDLAFAPEATREDVGALLDAVARVTTSQSTHEDLVTLLWEADLSGVRVDVAPVEHSLRVREFADLPDDASVAGLPGIEAADAALAPDGRPGSPAPARGQAEPDPAKRHDAATAPMFQDWAIPAEAGDALEAWRALSPGEREARAEFVAAWTASHASPWTARVEGLMREALALDPGPNTCAALGHTLVTWLGGAIQRCEWDEAMQALAALQGVDPDGAFTREDLVRVLQAIDAEAVAERLDESDAEAQGQFFALTVRVGRPALDLLVRVLAIATRVRLRAAATTALSYLCADEPRLLAPYVTDPRWYVVRNVVFVLGQIGGPDVADLLATAARHADARVRRTVVHALGQAPPERRLPLLVDLLESTDAQTVAAVLAMLSRESSPRVTAALLDRVTAADFESRPEDVRYALVAALGDAPAGDVVPTLEQVLQKGGWFARRTAERTAAALALARIGTPAAMEVLQTGLRSRSEAIRSSCQEALTRRVRAA